MIQCEFENMQEPNPVARQTIDRLFQSDKKGGKI